MSVSSLACETSDKLEITQTPVYYGDKIRLWVSSNLPNQEGETNNGYLGSYYKIDKYGSLLTVPPLGQPYQALFESAVFTVVDPHQSQRSEGKVADVKTANDKISKRESRHDSESIKDSVDVPESSIHTSSDHRTLRYGDEFFLVDQDNLCWNSVQGNTGNLIGTRPLGSVGDAVLTLLPPSGKNTGDAVYYHDKDLSIDVYHALKSKAPLNRRVRNVRPNGCEIKGGYLSTNTDGHDISFTIRPNDTFLGKVSLIRSIGNADTKDEKIHPNRMPRFDREFYASFVRDSDCFPDGVALNETTSSFGEVLTADVGQDGSFLPLGHFSPVSTEEYVPLTSTQSHSTDFISSLQVTSWGSELDLITTKEENLPSDAILVISVPDVGIARVPAFALAKSPLTTVKDGQILDEGGVPLSPEDSLKYIQPFNQSEFPIEGPFSGAVIKTEWSCTKVITTSSKTIVPEEQDQTEKSEAIKDSSNKNQTTTESTECNSTIPSKQEEMKKKTDVAPSQNKVAKTDSTASISPKFRMGVSALCLLSLVASGTIYTFDPSSVELCSRVALVACVGFALVNAPIYGDRLEAAYNKAQKEIDESFEPTETSDEAPSASESLATEAKQETEVSVVTIDKSNPITPNSSNLAANLKTVEPYVEHTEDIQYIWTLRITAPRDETTLDLTQTLAPSSASVRSLNEDKIMVSQILQAIRSSVLIADGIDPEKGTDDATHREVSKQSVVSTVSKIQSKVPSASVSVVQRNVQTKKSTLTETQFTVKSPHPQLGSTLDVRDCEPELFKRIRDSHHISTEDFITSWTFAANEIPELTLGAGRSGQLFLASNDKKFIFKTVTDADLTTLIAVLHDYADYVCTNPSRLMKFLGLLRLTFPKGKPLHIVVATNMFDLGDVKPPKIVSPLPQILPPTIIQTAQSKSTRLSKNFSFNVIPESEETTEEPESTTIASNTVQSANISTSSFLESGFDESDELDLLTVEQKFDLKGRKPKKPSHLRPSESNRGIWKDNQLARVFNLDPVIHSSILETLQRDVEFLKNHDMIDYSLLVGVVPTTNKYIPDHLAVPQRDEHVGIAPLVASATNDEEFYTVGIIDFLSRYQTWKKKTAHLLKSIRWSDEELSTVNAPFYAKRFLDYLDVVFPDPKAILVQSLDDIPDISEDHKATLLKQIQKSKGTGGIALQLSTGQAVVLVPEGVSTAPKLPPSAPNSAPASPLKQ